MELNAKRDDAVTRDSLSQMPGLVVVEFGSEWCGICRAFAPRFQELLQSFPAIQYLKIEDGKGKPLGRSFGVTLWPTLILQRDGKVHGKLVRPNHDETLRALESLAETPP